MADTPPFVHLHTHSHYSLLSGLAKIDALVEDVRAKNMNAVALTDYGALYGAIEFYKACKDANIQPIIGLDAYVAPFSHTQKRPKIDTRPSLITLLARTNKGYENLIELTTKAHLQGFYYKPRVDEELLDQYNEGLIALTGGLGGSVPRLLIAGDMEKAKQLLERYRKRYGAENVYLELQHHPTMENQKVVNDALRQLAQEEGFPLVATNDVHYLSPEDADAQDIVTCIQQQRTVNDPSRQSFAEENYSMRPPHEMYELFKNTPEALENTLKIAEKCHVEIELGNIQLPHFPLPKEQPSADAYLRALCEEGYERRFNKPYEHATPTQKERLDMELGVIEKTGFAAYFLIVQDFVRWAKTNGIVVGPGRGSAAGSFASYLLDIVDLDPIEYDLLFERFLNIERLSMPDIDLDFADTRRDEVIHYVTEKYGADRVAHIITFGTMAAKASVRDVGRVLGMPYDTCDRISKLIPMFTKLGDAVEQVEELKQLYTQDPEITRLIDTAKRIEGNARHTSTHACAMVVTKDPLTKDIPLQHGSAETDITTQYSMGPVEDLGILKMDFLGLKNLSIMERALEIIHATRPDRIDLRTIPMDDPKAYALLQQGETTGVFQLESAGMKRYLKQLQPTEFEDIIAMVALYRPGPMELIPSYVNRKHGREKVTYIHEKLAPILDTTYGIAIYQEQVMRIARDLAGFSLGEADVLRKAMGKKIKQLLDEQKEKFVEGCEQTGVGADIGREIFAFIEPFANYGFNRSHAACYALIAYQTAYLKANYPSEFMAALLTADQENTDRVAIEITECESMGIEVLPPDINESFKDFAVVPQKEVSTGWPIRFGLAGIKNLGTDTIAAIRTERKEHGAFTSFEDFISRVPAQSLNKRGLEALAKSGALDRFAERAQILYSMDTILGFAKQTQKAKAHGQQDLFGSFDDVHVPTLKLKGVTPATKQERLQWEKELLGLYVSEHPLDEWKPFFNTFTIPIATLKTTMAGQYTRVGGFLASMRLIQTKTGKTMGFARLEDHTGSAEVVVFPKLYEATRDIWQEDHVVILEARIDNRDDELKLLADKVKRLDLTHVQRWQEHTPPHERNAHKTNTRQKFLPRDNTEDLSKPTSPHPVREEASAVSYS